MRSPSPLASVLHGRLPEAVADKCRRESGYAAWPAVSLADARVSGLHFVRNEETRQYGWIPAHAELEDVVSRWRQLPLRGTSLE